MADISDSENTTLMSGGGVKNSKKQPDWSRFGLSAEQQKGSEKVPIYDGSDGTYQHGVDSGQKNELFREDQDFSQKPWWKANFFISSPVLFGTWDGVFTSTLINILSVVIFLRMGWIVGNAGIGLSVLTVLISISIALIVALSAIGVCERCNVESGGVYFLVAHVLGSRIGGSVGIIYCFAQSVSCSLAVIGFGESITELLQQDNQWIARGIATAVVLLLCGINVAGVKWVIRLQLLLLIVLFLSALDLIVGSFVHTDPVNGVTGYSDTNFRNNSGPRFVDGESFFSIFGLFFASVTGILAGINMSGDLRDPFHNIPHGTLSALGVATFLYISFILVLGATCARSFLQDEYMIAEKVSIVGVLWLAGLYISSVSSCMGSLYGPPRILQTIANENVIPIIKVLGQGRGPNKVPIFAIIVITLTCLIFILIGDLNTLAPIVTTAFMLTYAAVDYSYFALAMSYDRRKEREVRYLTSSQGSQKVANGYGSLSSSTVDLTQNKDSLEKFATDLDKLFPERLRHRGHTLVRQSSVAGTPTTPEADFDATKRKASMDNVSEQSDTSHLIDASGVPIDPKKMPNTEITKMPRSWYSVLCNRWIALLGTLICLIIMFAIQWMYALGELLAILIVYIYIGKASPGYFPGIAEFNFYEWLKGCVLRCCNRGYGTQEQIVVAPKTPAVHTLAAQLTEDNQDFSSRGRYHQSEIVRGENFDDYDSE